MDLIDAAILGLIEGLTEYLPVSSTGHLVVAQRLLRIPEGDAANAFAIVIQAGAIMAVLFLYHHRVASVLNGIIGRSREGLHMGLSLVAAFIPAAVAGLLAGDMVKHYLFNIPSIATAWFFWGVVLVGMALKHRSSDSTHGNDLEQLTIKMAFIIGLFQCLALWPGTSRSLVTILGGLAVGLNMTAAVEFSFLLGVITLGAATVKDSWDHGAVMISQFGWLALAVGFNVAAISAFLAVKWMVGYVSRRGMTVFGWYRIALSGLVALYLIIGD